MARTGGENVARALLFDRLSDAEPREPREARPFRTYSRAELLESVRREVTQLFNTRCPIPAPELERRERSIIDYGIPDLSYYSPGNDDSEQALRRMLRNTLAVFEPRIADPEVTIEHFVGRHQRMLVQVHGALIMGSIREPISFSVAIEAQGDRIGTA
jgi:type VI secretion system lysozyme-related protein